MQDQEKNQNKNDQEGQQKELDKLKEDLKKTQQLLAAKEEERSKLQKLAERMASNEQVVTLLKNPSKKFKLVEESEPSPKSVRDVIKQRSTQSLDEDEEETLSSMSPSKLLEVIADAMEETAKHIQRNLSDSVDSKLKPVVDSVEKIGGFLVNKVKDEERNRVSGRFKDFDKFKDDIDALVAKGYSYQDAYFVAKGNRVANQSDDESQNEAESERPNLTSINVRRRGNQSQGKSVSSESDANTRRFNYREIVRRAARNVANEGRSTGE